MPYISHKYSLEQLNDDCIKYIVDELHFVLQYEANKIRSLHSFSTVSRKCRKIASSVLFSRCVAPVDIRIRGFIPKALWPYVRVLKLIGPYEPGYFFLEKPEHSKCLQHLPSLRKIHISDFACNAKLLYSFMTSKAPMLQEIHVRCEWNAPVARQQRNNTFVIEPFPPTETSINGVSWTRSVWTVPDENHLCWERALLRALCLSLKPTIESLDIPLESAPVQELMSTQWPSLRDLSLSAQYPPSLLHISLDYRSIFIHAPKLNTLSVMMTRTAGAGPTILLSSPRSTSGVSLEHLQRLAIAYPCAADTIFDHLPNSLRHLALSDYPRHYHSLDDPPSPFAQKSWTSPIPTSAELLEIFGRCRTPNLENLEIVYTADSTEQETLTAMAVRFPRLRTLTIFRYASSDDDYIDVRSVGMALSGLAELRRIFAHFDTPKAPRHRTNAPPTDRWKTSSFWVCLEMHAQMLVETLPHSLELICLLERHHLGTQWVAWKVISADKDKKQRTCDKIKGYVVPCVPVTLCPSTLASLIRKTIVTHQDLSIV